MRDTSARVEVMQIAAFRRMSPKERVAMAFEASEWIMSIARARPGAVITPTVRDLRSKAALPQPFADRDGRAP